ncbi:dioxygenase family protein [Klenkia taihuensis]|uniref:Aromatic ring-opening dioxygenase, catalytic subunit, LigB family n=1 Tax=Klenkia taihuensis TaxID=1225127 RepID=A0A1I1U8J7_9ACTN|nr:class III extradiol ring-cleavage dioxygenase [Klenkia taihuensis]GHE06928.1 dioxygenase [Klenkia taihuensis]SFD65898.1 Aromatic ring-opening dioxygenase, catalytic subunit, LigB family [Klenkia taihuensis]
MPTTPTTTQVADARIPAAHPFAGHLRRAQALEQAAPHRTWTPEDGPLPSLYVSHGGGPMPFASNDWLDPLHDWARSLPKPRAILVVSAHWESAPLSLSADRPADLVYDFGGFDPLYDAFRYDTPDAGDLARTVAGLMPDTQQVHQHTRRGLDHGAWVPLKIMYPSADVPVLQLSLPTEDPDELLALGQRLRPLRESGVLVVGSGHMTHGLPFLTRENFTQNTAPAWSVDFDAWAADALARGDVAELARFRDAAPGMPYAHPTVEHFTPLFVALGAATDPAAPVTTMLEGYGVGLSRRSFQAA